MSQRRKKESINHWGGPAGMEAARVAALKGHKVILYEKCNTLGGQLNLGMVAPGKEKINWYKEYLLTQINKLGVNVRLDVEATVEVVYREKPDAVIMATGGEPLIPDIPGVNSRHVVTNWDILKGKVDITNKDVIIVGGGLVGCETALFLAQKGNRVTIIEMLDRIAGNEVFITRMDLLERLAATKIKFRTRLSLDAISGEGILAVDREHKKEFLKADLIVLSLGLRPVNPMEAEIRSIVPEVYVVGDSKEPGRIFDATYSGYVMAKMI